MFSGASTFVEGVDFAFALIIGISLFFLVVLTIAMIWFVIKYNRKRNPKSEDVKESMGLEMAWTIIPTILVLIMFYYGWVGYAPMREKPENALEIKTIGYQWGWKFEYPNGKVTDTLVVPLDKPVVLNLFSDDVLHAFYIPAFRIKEDVTPAVKNWMWFQALEEGSFDVFCAEYCGDRHSYMLTKVIVKKEADYLAWAQSKAGDLRSRGGSKGEVLVNNNACKGCHSTTGDKLTGPTFKGLFGSKRQVSTNGASREVTADEAYIKSSIITPNADVVEGFAPSMPGHYGTVFSEDDLKEIIGYIQSLK